MKRRAVAGKTPAIQQLPLLRVQFKITSSPGSPCGPTMPCVPGEPCKNTPWDTKVSTISFDHICLSVEFIRMNVLEK